MLPLAARALEFQIASAAFGDPLMPRTIKARFGVGTEASKARKNQLAAREVSTSHSRAW